MDAIKSYKFGLFGRCPICKEIFKINCQQCGANDNFVDSGRSNHVLCLDCRTHNQLICPKSECQNAPLQYRTPKNEDERQRIELYIKIKLEKITDHRIFRIKENRYRSVVQVVEIAPDGSYCVPAMKDRPITDNQSFVFAGPRQTVPTENTGIVPGKERRIVNQFYDEIEDTRLDKKTVFEVVYDETVYYNCSICGLIEMVVKCPACGSRDKFNLNYEALSCSCGNSTKIVACDCGAKQSHLDLFLKSDDVKWQFSRAKSYYDYCKGRMTVFSTCPTCTIFSAEQCSVCGSKVNFGLPNQNNEVFCKSCGTVNKFQCDNLRCNQIVKTLKNPESTEQKFEWLQKVVNLRREALQKVTVSRLQETDLLPTYFVEKIQQKNKEMLTDTFINEVAKEVDQVTITNNTILEHNRKKTVGSTVTILVVTLLVIIAILIYQISELKKNTQFQNIYQEIVK